MAKFYVYRFLNKSNEVLYVGKTNNLDNRMSQHFGKKGHLGQDKYDLVDKIEYIELKTKVDMDIRELYYISKWKPEFNIVSMSSDGSEMVLKELNWNEYKKRVKKVKEKDELITLKFKVSEKKAMAILGYKEEEFNDAMKSGVELRKEIKDYQIKLAEKREENVNITDTRLIREFKERGIYSITWKMILDYLYKEDEEKAPFSQLKKMEIMTERFNLINHIVAMSEAYGLILQFKEVDEYINHVIEDTMKRAEKMAEDSIKRLERLGIVDVSRTKE